ncbi:MAG: RagB/SusD family nutrient uptake outer membrane protein [Bacteroidales bacterium]
MRNIFKIYTMGALLTGALLSTSCSDYLDKFPENTMPVEEIDYTNTADAYKPVMGIYTTLGTKAREWGFLGMIAVRGDDVYKGGNGPGDQGSLNNFRDFNYGDAKNFWVSNNYWRGYYDVVIKGNLALTSLDRYAEHANDADKAKIEGYKHEVRFLRAYSYYQLARMFGGVPVFTDNNSSDGFYKKSHEEVLRFVIAEAEACAATLPAVMPVDMEHKGAVSRYSALALKAKAAADILDYAKVLEATTPIIAEAKAELEADYYNLFKLAGKYNRENLFEIQFTFAGAETGDSFLSNEFFIFQGPGVGANFRSNKKFGANKDQNLGGGWGFLPVTEELNELMIARGEKVRYETTVLKTTGMKDANGKEFNITADNDTLYAGNEGSPTMYNGKAYSPSKELLRNVYGGDKNILVFRYADILLLDAEAKVQTGKNGDESFNKVRRRAGLSELSNVTFDQIMEERFVELACENGERYFDMVRTGKALTEWADRGHGYTAAKRFYPIPQEQVDLNPNLAD